MELRTYTRARAAVAAAKKALGHLEAFISAYDAAEKNGRFYARVELRSGAGKEIESAVKAAGFDVMEGRLQELKEQPSPEKKVSEAVAEQHKKRRAGYINENSSVVGACELARSIAASMPDASRKEVIEACRKAGIAYGTARTQVQNVRGGK